jgi:hypothetical protein
MVNHARIAAVSIKRLAQVTTRGAKSVLSRALLPP